MVRLAPNPTSVTLIFALPMVRKAGSPEDFSAGGSAAALFFCSAGRRQDTPRPRPITDFPKRAMNSFLLILFSRAIGELRRLMV